MSSSPAWSRCARGGLTAAGLTLVLVGLLPANASSLLAAGTVALTGGPYTQDFDSLSNVAGSTANTVSMPGWDLSESGDGARDNERYAADNGASTLGDTYSYGSADSSDRALGGLNDDTLVPVLGASFTNATGSPIISIDIQYTGELWRLETADRSDRLDFQVSTSATSLTTGTWTDVDSLDFATPSTSSSTGERDGNDAANRTFVSSSIGDLSIADGATIWIRWVAFDVAGPDDGLAVDDFAVTPHADTAPAVSATDPADGATGVAPDGSVSVTFDEPVDVTGEWFTIECATSGVHPATAAGGPTSFDLDPATDFVAGEQCTVRIVAAQVTDQDNDDPPDHPSADHVLSFTIEPAAPAHRPTARDDTASTPEDTPVGIRVTANDADDDGDLVPASVRVVRSPGAGDATVTTNGTVRYTPGPNFHGRDSLDYRVCDTGGRCDVASVSVSITEVADPPVAGDIAVSTVEDGAVVINVIGSAIDPDGDIASVVVVASPAHGRATVTGGSIRYTPMRHFHGRDHFGYRVCDTGGRCDGATVTISITAVAEPPVAGNDNASTPEDTPVGIRVTDNDADPDGDLASVAVLTDPAHGRAVAVGGSIRYTPAPNFHGRDHFDYRVCDTGGRCDRATVRISVTAVGDPPVADDVAVTTAEDHPVAIKLIHGATDPDGDLASVAVLTDPAHGRAVAVGGSIRYTPAPNFHGRDHFDYRVCDVTSGCATATVTVTILPVNDAPIAVPEDVTITWAGPIVIDVLANDTDVDGSADLDPYSVTIITGPVIGTATVNATAGAIEYTAAPGTVGSDQVTYRVCDLEWQCATAALTLRLDVPLTATTTLPPPLGTLPNTGSRLGTDAVAAALAGVVVGTMLLAVSRRTGRLRSNRVGRTPSTERWPG